MSDTDLRRLDAIATVHKYVVDDYYRLHHINYLAMVLCSLLLVGLIIAKHVTNTESAQNKIARAQLITCNVATVLILVHAINRRGAGTSQFIQNFISDMYESDDRMYVSAGMLDDFFGRECTSARPEIKNNFILAVTELAENDTLFESWLEQVKKRSVYNDISVAIAKGHLQKNPSDIQRIFDAVGTERLSDLKDFYNDIARTNKNVVPWAAAVAMHDAKQHAK